MDIDTNGSFVIPGRDFTVFENNADPIEGMSDLEEDVYYLLCNIKDPEFPYSLGRLRVIIPEGVKVFQGRQTKIHIEFKPTVKHCSLASLIGLSIKHKLTEYFGPSIKTYVCVTAGFHDDEWGLNKQLNDKERIAAAMENPAISKIVSSVTRDNEF